MNELIRSITIGETTYNMAAATAVKQRALLSLVGATVTARSAIASATSGEIANIDIPFLKGALINAPEETIIAVSNIVLWKCAKAGTGEAVTMDSFQNAMNDYLTLLAEGVRYNLADFFTWLHSENESVVQQNKPKLKPE